LNTYFGGMKCSLVLVFLWKQIERESAAHWTSPSLTGRRLRYSVNMMRLAVSAHMMLIAVWLQKGRASSFCGQNWRS